MEIRRGWLVRGLLGIGVWLGAVGLVAGAVPASAQSAGEFALTATPIGNTSAALTWSAQPDAASYTVYAAQTVVIDPAVAELPERPAEDQPHPLERVAPGTWVALVQGVQDTTLTLRDLPPEGTFAVVVRPVTRDGQERSPSSVATVSLAGAPGGWLTVTVPAVGTIDLSWQEVPGAARYALLVGPPGHRLTTDARQQPVSGTTLRLTGVAPGTPVRFAIEAQDGEGNALARTDSAALVMPTPSMFGPPAIGPSIMGGIGQ